MKIGIFSKLDYAGGSEFRCVEMANALVRHTQHEAWLLAEGQIASRIYERIQAKVHVVPNLLRGDQHVTRPASVLYEMDCLIVVNTDSKEFTTPAYWRGATDRHPTVVELKRLTQMVFLFNFIVSPSAHLAELQKSCHDVRILTANRKFFNEISEQDRYRDVRHFPRLMLESPIDPHSVSAEKSVSGKIRIGMHSLGLADKWNQDFPAFIRKLNEQFGDKLEFRFMGMPGEVAEQLKNISNVKIYRAFQMPVGEFLREVDIFSFMGSFRREEPWSRAVAEALMSGAPVLATHKGGNGCQIVHGNNGYLCGSTAAFFAAASELIEDRVKYEAMRKNALRMSIWFSSAEVVKRLETFIGD
jgi:hypothetical protein